MTRTARITVAYAFSHFVVDLASVTTVLGLVAPHLASRGPRHVALAILAYDLVAFCCQLPLGALLDVWGRRRSPAAAMASFALVACGVSAGWAGGLTTGAAAVTLVALGNALFHCVGGVEVLGESDGRAAPSGVFISTGALGVFLGGQAAFGTWPGTPVLLVALLVASAAFVLWVPAANVSGGLYLALSPGGRLAAILLSVTVALRSYAGMVMSFPWKAQLILALLAVVAVAAGKATGGYASDALGAPIASAVSLGGAAVLFLFSWASVTAGLVATFLFNFTMAITLSALAELFPRAHGLAFGIASFALAMGALPALLGPQGSSGLTLCILSLVSLACLEAALAFMRLGRPATVTVRMGFGNACTPRRSS